MVSGTVLGKPEINHRHREYGLPETRRLSMLKFR